MIQIYASPSLVAPITHIENGFLIKAKKLFCPKSAVREGKTKFRKKNHRGVRKKILSNVTNFQVWVF